MIASRRQGVGKNRRKRIGSALASVKRSYPFAGIVSASLARGRAMPGLFARTEGGDDRRIALTKTARPGKRSIP